MKLSSMKALKFATLALFISVNGALAEQIEARTNMMKIINLHKPKHFFYSDPGFNVTENALNITVELEILASDKEPIDLMVSVLNPAGQMVPDQNSYARLLSRNGSKILVSVHMAGYHLLEPNSNVYLTVMTRKNSILHLLFVAPEYSTLPKEYFGKPEDVIKFVKFVFVFSPETLAKIRTEISANRSIDVKLHFNTNVKVKFVPIHHENKLTVAPLTDKQTNSYWTDVATPIEISTLDKLGEDIAEHADNYQLFSEGYRPITKSKINKEISSGRKSMVVNFVDKNRKLTNYVIFPSEREREPICEARPTEKSIRNSITIQCTGAGDEISYTANYTLYYVNGPNGLEKAEGFEKIQIHHDVYFIKAGATPTDFGSYRVDMILSDYADNYVQTYESNIVEVQELGKVEFGLQELQILIWITVSLLLPTVFATLSYCSLYSNLE